MIKINWAPTLFRSDFLLVLKFLCLLHICALIILPEKYSPYRSCLCRES